MSQHILQETLWIFFWMQPEAVIHSKAMVGSLKMGPLDWWWGVLVLRLKTLKGGPRNKRQEGKTQQRKKKAMAKMWKSAGCYRMMEAAGGVGPWAGVRAEHLWQRLKMEVCYPKTMSLITYVCCMFMCISSEEMPHCTVHWYILVIWNSCGGYYWF